MITMGDQRVGKYVIDGCNLEDKGPGHGPFSYWYYNKDFFRSRTSPAVIKMENNSSMNVESDKTKLLFKFAK